MDDFPVGYVFGINLRSKFQSLAQAKKHTIFSCAISTSGATYLVTMVCVCLVVRLYLTEGPPPPTNHQISKIPKPNCVSAHSEQLFWGTPPNKGKIFDTRFGLIHVQTGKKNFHRGTPPPCQ